MLILPRPRGDELLRRSNRAEVRLVVCDKQLGQHSDREQLAAEDHHGYPVQRRRPRLQADRFHARHPRDQPNSGHAGEPEGSQEERPQADRSQQVLGPLPEPGEKLDGQQVEETLDNPRRAVLRAAELAGTVDGSPVRPHGIRVPPRAPSRSGASRHKAALPRRSPGGSTSCRNYGRASGRPSDG